MPLSSTSSRGAGDLVCAVVGRLVSFKPQNNIKHTYSIICSLVVVDCNRCDPGIMGPSSMSYLAQQLLLDLVGVGKGRNSRASPGQEGRFRSSGDIDVRDTVVYQKFGRTLSSGTPNVECL
jgi:hypothetical protein